MMIIIPLGITNIQLHYMDRQNKTNGALAHFPHLDITAQW